MNHVKFADDIFTSSKTPVELQNMLTDPNRESFKVGLTMNKTQTEKLFNDKIIYTTIRIERDTLEEVDKYIYLGQIMKVNKDHGRK